MTEKEKKVYDCVQQVDDGNGLPASAYYVLYGPGMSFDDSEEFDLNKELSNLNKIMEEKKELGLSEFEFTNVLDSLAKQGLISKKKGLNGGTLYSKTVITKGLENRSNAMYSIESKFSKYDKDELIKVAINSFEKVLNSLSHMGDTIVVGTLMLGIRLGVAGDGVLSDVEKELIRTLFKNIYNGSPNDLYDMVGTTIKESDYNLVSSLIRLNDELAMNFLNLVLAVAYIDGVLEDDVAKRLDEIYGLIFLKNIFNSEPYDENNIVAQNQSNAATSEHTNDTKVKKDDIDDALYEFMKSSGRLFTVSMLSEIPQFSDYAKPFLWAHLRKMVEQGKLEKITDDGIVFFGAI